QPGGLAGRPGGRDRLRRAALAGPADGAGSPGASGLPVRAAGREAATDAPGESSALVRRRLRAAPGTSTLARFPRRLRPGGTRGKDGLGRPASRVTGAGAAAGAVRPDPLGGEARGPAHAGGRVPNRAVRRRFDWPAAGLTAGPPW